jgi:hypothetical protein
MVVSLAPTLAVRQHALAGASVRLRALAPSPAESLGNARYGAPSLSAITIVVNSTIFLWTWMLVMQEGRAAMLGGRRCFFSVVLPFMDCVEVMAVATMDLLLPWCPSASPHHGLERPLGGASSISRTVMRPVGRTLLGGGRGTGAPRSCATATSSTAARTTHTKASCGALMATWSPCSS